MTPEFVVIGNNYGRSGYCVYLEDEYSLSYEYEEAAIVSKDSSSVKPWWAAIDDKKPEDIIISFNSFTLVFDGASGEFLSFDTYTSRTSWMEIPIIHQPKCQKGVLYVIMEQERIDRYDFGYEPTFEYDQKGDLKIIFSDQEGATFYKIKDNLIVGIKAHQLTALIAEGVLL